MKNLSLFSIPLSLSLYLFLDILFSSPFTSLFTHDPFWAEHISVELFPFLFDRRSFHHKTSLIKYWSFKSTILIKNLKSLVENLILRRMQTANGCYHLNSFPSLFVSFLNVFWPLFTFFLSYLLSFSLFFHFSYLLVLSVRPCSNVVKYNLVAMACPFLNCAIQCSFKNMLLSSVVNVGDFYSNFSYIWLFCRCAETELQK